MAATGAAEAVGESMVLLVCTVLPGTVTDAEVPCSGAWLLNAVLSVGGSTGNEETHGSDDAVAGAVRVASAGLRISLCGARR